MKSMRFSHFAAPILGLLTGSVLVYASADKEVPPGGATITATTGSAQVAPAAAAGLQPVVAPGEDIVSPSWTKIADCNYDARGRFFTGLQDLEAKADAQIRELDAKRRAMPSTVDTKDWDFQMKNMVEARAYLKDMDSELRKAGPDTWDEQKARVGYAWDRVQDAYAQVKASTTY
ncbi:MAG TPA: hypothetical protein VHD32_18495 [Candidatus Didemnitutus sp.]|nr:hypothetical protein [Candidatus Didemnitutus sp.]